MTDDPLFRFTLILERLNSTAEQPLPCLAEDGVAGLADGVPFVDFARRAPDLSVAVSGAIRVVESQGCRVRRVEPDDLVTAAEIAERLGRSRESIRLLASGARGSGGFPPPISHARSRQRLWRWSDIASWADRVDEQQQREARYLAVVNAALEVRSLADCSDDFVRSLIGKVAGEVAAPTIGPATAPAGSSTDEARDEPPDAISPDQPHAALAADHGASEETTESADESWFGLPAKRARFWSR